MKNKETKPTNQIPPLSGEVRWGNFPPLEGQREVINER